MSSSVILDAEELSDLIGSEMETFSVELDGTSQKVKLQIIPRPDIGRDFAERALKAMLDRRLKVRIISKTVPKPGYVLEYPLYEGRIKLTSYKVMERKRIIRVTLTSPSGKRKRGP